MAWLADGSGLLMLAAGQETFRQIWYLPYPEGEARNLSNDLNNYADLSLTADSGALATVQSAVQANIWIASVEDAARARQITFGANRIEGGAGISWAPDGRIVYSSATGGGVDIWIIDADGKNQRQLTADARTNNHPSVTPDGRYIFFLSDRTGVPHIWRTDLDGGDPKQLTNGAGEQNPTCSPDGRWVIYRTVFGELTIWRVPVEGGEPVQLTDKPSDGPATVSPDSKLIAYFTDYGGPLRIAIIPFEGGEPLKTFDVPPTILGVGGLRWTPDGRDLAYAGTHESVSNIWTQSLDGGAPKQLTDFKSDRIFWFDWSRDGKQLVLSRGNATSDVVMISNFSRQQ
jgi:TolB protein